MELAHEGLAPEPLPGGREDPLSGGPDGFPLPGEQDVSLADDQNGGGFFEDLGRLFGGSSKSEPDGGKKKKNTAYERMKQQKDSK